MNHKKKLLRCSTGVKKVLLIYPAKFVTTYWTAGKLPLEYLKADKKIVSYKEILPYHVIDADMYDVDIIYCLRWADRITKQIYEVAKEMGKPFVYFVDDNFFIIPEDATLQKVKEVEAARAFLAKVDVAVVSTQALYETVKKYNDNVILLKPYQKCVDNLMRKTSAVKNDCIVIGHMSSIYRDIHFEFVLPAIKRIIREFGDKVRFEFIGYKPKELEGYDHVTFFDFLIDYDKFQEFFVSRHWDIGLAPLKDIPFARSKSNAKFREFGAFKVCGIYSNICCYSECVEHKVSGYIVENTPEAWYLAMRKLILDEKLRKRIKKNAYKYVARNHSMKVFCRELMNIFEDTYQKHYGIVKKGQRYRIKKKSK